MSSSLTSPKLEIISTLNDLFSRVILLPQSPTLLYLISELTSHSASLDSLTKVQMIAGELIANQGMSLSVDELIDLHLSHALLNFYNQRYNKNLPPQNTNIILSIIGENLNQGSTSYQLINKQSHSLARELNRIREQTDQRAILLSIATGNQQSLIFDRQVSEANKPLTDTVNSWIESGDNRLQVMLMVNLTKSHSPVPGIGNYLLDAITTLAFTNLGRQVPSVLNLLKYASVISLDPKKFYPELRKDPSGLLLADTLVHLLPNHTPLNLN